MQAFLTIAAILGLTALFSYINERLLRLQQTIGLMLLAIGATLTGAVLIGLATWWLLGLLGIGLGLIFALVFGALISPTYPIAALAILHMTYGVVALSIIVQGLTISRFFEADQLKRLLADG
ncbi:MAG: hypothetical protein U9Q81_18740 [Pseudomonadota bacterium]|nr:hypothetical protein [Pseudomonadota bacterium]